MTKLSEEERKLRKKTSQQDWINRNRERYNQYQREWRSRRKAEFDSLKAEKNAAESTTSSIK